MIKFYGTIILLLFVFFACSPGGGGDDPFEPLDIEGFVWISSGTFTMGSSSTELGHQTNEAPQHQVTLTRGFYMGKYEVTQEQWKEVMTGNTNGINTTPSSFSSNPATGEVQERRPVEMVSWFDAIVFCNRLSIQEGLTSVYSISGTNPNYWGDVPTSDTHPNYEKWKDVEMISGAKGYRLPTEAEWEYACRAGTTTVYNTGDDAISDDTGWHYYNSGAMTHEVGKKPANSWGLYDMHGNVWDWCWDWYSSYAVSGDPETNPTGAINGSSHVARGGCWSNTDSALRSAFRNAAAPEYQSIRTGIRVVRNQ